MRNILSLAVVGLLAVSLSAVEPPVVNAVTPSPLVMSTDPVTLRVTGTGFAPGLTVEITSHGNTETFSGAAVQRQNATSFEVAVALSQPGPALLVVRNTDGGLSEPFTLKVEPVKGAEPTRGPQAMPVLERVSPDKTARTTVPVSLTLSGRSFSPALTVTMTSPTGVVTVIRGNSLEAVTPTSVRFSATLDVSGDYTFTVTNPPGQTSDTVTVVVT
jgi:hypothetical protein